MVQARARGTGRHTARLPGEEDEVVCGWRNASAYIATFRAAFGTTAATYQHTLTR